MTVALAVRPDVARVSTWLVETSMIVRPALEERFFEDAADSWTAVPAPGDVELADRVAVRPWASV